MNELPPDEQAYLDQANEAVAAAHQRGIAAEAAARVTGETSLGGVKQEFNPVERWLGELPSNASIGLIHMAVNAADSIKAFGGGVADNFKQLVAPPKLAAEPGAAPAPPVPVELPRHDHDDVYDVAKSHILNFADQMAQAQKERGDGGPVDQITQAGIQLAVPFAGFSKLLGGLRGAKGLAQFGRISLANAATDATAIDPHAEQMGRAADILDLARHTEGKLGDAMLSIAPDGSLLNSYIDFSHSRNESEASGRLKNILDGFLMNGAASTLFHTVAVGLKGGMATAKYALANAGELGPAGLKAQRGMVSFHGTPHVFEPTAHNPYGEFDLTKLGSGEGNQARGYGIYTAQAQGTGETYRQMLARRNIPKDSALDHAYAAMNIHGNDAGKAFDALRSRAGSASDARTRDLYSRAADLVKGGNVRIKGALYTVHTPDEVVAKYLDQDKAMAEQPAILRKLPAGDKKQLENLLEDHNQQTDLASYNGNQFRLLVERAMEEGYIAPVSGGGYGASTAAQDASEYFLKHGIPGSRYLDQFSRASPTSAYSAMFPPAGEGTHNFVHFDPQYATIIRKK